MNSDWLAHLDLLSTEALEAKYQDLLEEHRALDAAIAALFAQKPDDQFSLQRLKRRKLQLKDMIAMCHDLLTPDIIA